MPFARAPMTTLARTGIVAWTDLGPRRQAGRRAKPAHVRANLAQNVARRGRIDPGNTIELLDLRHERLDEQANLLVERGDRARQQISELE